VQHAHERIRIIDFPREGINGLSASLDLRSARTAANVLSSKIVVPVN